MIKYVVEFIGTFLFLSIILRSGSFGNVQPFVIVSGLLASILAGGAISGGHFNPAVSVMVHMKDSAAFGTQDMAGYIIAQVLGGLLALKAFHLAGDK